VCLNYSKYHNRYLRSFQGVLFSLTDRQGYVVTLHSHIISKRLLNNTEWMSPPLKSFRLLSLLVGRGVGGICYNMAIRPNRQKTQRLCPATSGGSLTTDQKGDEIILQNTIGWSTVHNTQSRP
jgi:hypothetical protein